MTLARRRSFGSPHGPAQLVLSQIASDNFNRANGTIAGSNNWLATSEAGSMAVASNAASSPSTLSQPAGIYRTGETYTGAQYSQVDIVNTTLPSGTYVGVSVRNQDNANNYEALYWNNGGLYQVTIFKKVAGTATQLASSSIGASPLASGTSLQLIAEGSLIQIRTILAGAVTGTIAVADTTFASGGTPGIISFTGSTGPASVDNWVGGNASTGAVGGALASDAFNRANGNVSVGSSGAWVLMNYPFSPATVEVPIVSNQLSTQNPPVTGHAGNVRTDAYSSDQWSQVQQGTAVMNGSGFVGITTRNQGSGGTLGNSGYLGVSFQNNAYRIYRLDNGVSTQLASAVAPGNDAAGTAYTLVSQGTRHSLRVNGSEVLAATDATYTGGKPGIMMFANSTADNWSGGNV